MKKKRSACERISLDFVEKKIFYCLFMSLEYQYGISKFSLIFFSAIFIFLNPLEVKVLTLNESLEELVSRDSRVDKKIFILILKKKKCAKIFFEYPILLSFAVIFKKIKYFLHEL